MDFRTELSKWGYNKGDSIDVDILVNEILPSLFSQQERSYSEEIIDILDNVRYWETCPDKYKIIIEEWLKQFKKK